MPTLNYGMVVRFRKRTGRVLNEGLNFIWPFIESVDLIEYKAMNLDVKTFFFSQDNLEVIINGSVRYRPDKNLVDKAFSEMTETAITKGIEDTIKQELGIIGGTKPASVFITSKEAVSHLINCVLRMEKPPHIALNLSPSKRLPHYKKEATDIRDALSIEHKNISDRSAVENRYGIDILEFSLALVDYSPKTKEALEKKKQVEAELKASKEKFDQTIKRARTIKTEELTPEQINAAQTSVGDAKKNVHSIEGKPININVGGDHEN